MPSIHVKDKLAARYVVLTGDTEDFKDFVNRVVEEAVCSEEEKARRGFSTKNREGREKKNE